MGFIHRGCGQKSFRNFEEFLSCEIQGNRLFKIFEIFPGQYFLVSISSKLFKNSCFFRLSINHFEQKRNQLFFITESANVLGTLLICRLADKNRNPSEDGLLLNNSTSHLVNQSSGEPVICGQRLPVCINVSTPSSAI